MGVTLFPSETLCATNIPPRNCNNTNKLFRIEGEHAGESFMSLMNYGFLKYTSVKLKFADFAKI